MRSLGPLLRRLALVQLKANPPKPETRLPWVVIDQATGEDIPGYREHNAEHRALARHAGVPVKEYTFDPAALYSEQPWAAFTDEELLERFFAIDEESIPEEHDAALLATDRLGGARRLYRVWYHADRARCARAAALGSLSLDERESIWQWIEAYAPGVIQ
jgi:hypothetical protein